MSAAVAVRERVRSAVADPLLLNSWLMLTTTLLMAGSGSVFWVIAARLQTPENVGLAGSLVSTAEAIAVLAQLGLGIALIRTMPTSNRKAADVTAAASLVTVTGLVVALVYGLALPVLSPRLSHVVHPTWTLLVFAVLVAATAVNQLTDGIFLAVDRVASNLRINGVLMGVVKCALPFALAGAGAIGLYGAVGAATLVAAVASMVVLLRHLPGGLSLVPSRQLLEARRFAGVGYVTTVLYLAPQLVFPVIIINAVGASSAAVYFIGFQIVTLLNSGVYSVSNSMYAECSRYPDRVTSIVRKAGTTIAVAGSVGVVVLLVLSPLLLRVFGASYSDEGTATLRVLTVGSLGVALNYWSAMRLRVARHHTAMILVQLFTTTLMIVAALVVADRGIEWVAGAWGVGQACGGLVGHLVSRTVAPLVDEPAPAVPAGR